MVEQEPQKPQEAEETETPIVPEENAPYRFSMPPTRAAGRSQSLPTADVPVKLKRNSVVMESDEYDLANLMSFDPLQQLVKQLVCQQTSQLLMIQNLEARLEESLSANEKQATQLQQVVETKASEKALGSLALEVSKEKTAKEKGVAAVQERVSAKLVEADARVGELQRELSELRRTLGDKAGAKELSAVSARLDGCAQHADLAATREGMEAEIRRKAAEPPDPASPLGLLLEKLKHITAVDHTGRLVALEELLPALLTLRADAARAARPTRHGSARSGPCAPHRSGGPPACARLPSGPERGALALRMPTECGSGTP